MKRLRSQLSLSDYRQGSFAIMKSCIDLEEWYYARTIHIYVSSVNNEVDTLGLIFKMFDSGKNVAVPRCSSELHTMYNISIESFEELSRGRFGIMEPPYDPAREVLPEKLDLVIAPLLAFDRTGGRLGFGGGYYDKLLSECTCPKIGLAYACQEVAAVPGESHDQKLDIIITEQQKIRIKHD